MAERSNIVRYNIHKADRKLFKILTITNDFTYRNIADINMLLNKVYETIERASQIAIPTTSGHRYNLIPWWNAARRVSHKQRKCWIRKYRRTKSMQDKIRKYRRTKSMQDKRELNKASAIARKTKMQARRQAWKDFVSSINSNTMSKIWKKVRKIAGKHSMGSPPCLNINGTIESNSKRVANSLGSRISYISSTANYDAAFLPTKMRSEAQSLHFNATEYHAYNDCIQVKEIMHGLKTCKIPHPGRIR